MDAVYMIDIAVVSEPPEGFMSDDVEARFEVYSTMAFDMTGKAVLDIGATATVGSLEALEALMQVKASRGEHETVKVYPDCRRKFRFGNGEVAESLSYIEIPQRLDGKLIYLGIHTMDTSNVPILLSIKTLKKLGAIIDIGRRLVIFQFFKPLIRLSQIRCVSCYAAICPVLSAPPSLMPLSRAVRALDRISPEVGPAVADDPELHLMLTNKEVGLSGAEVSLQRRLDPSQEGRSPEADHASRSHQAKDPDASNNAAEEISSESERTEKQDSEWTMTENARPQGESFQCGDSRVRQPGPEVSNSDSGHVNISSSDVNLAQCELDRIEQEAHRLHTCHHYDWFSCEQLLNSISFEKVAQRMSVISKSGGQYVSFGLFSHGNQWGICSRSQDMPCLCRYINAFLRFQAGESGAEVQNWSSFTLGINVGPSWRSMMYFVVSFEVSKPLTQQIKNNMLHEAQTLPSEYPGDEHAREQFGAGVATFGLSAHLRFQDYGIDPGVSGARDSLEHKHGDQGSFSDDVSLATCRRVLHIVQSDKNTKRMQAQECREMYGFSLDAEASAMAVSEALTNPEKMSREDRAIHAQVMKLHRRCGHPNNRALMNRLKTREVDERTLKIAEHLHCDECQQMRLAEPHVNVALDRSEVLWHTLQIDHVDFRFQDTVVQILVMTDEASQYTVACEMHRRHHETSRNATTSEVISASEREWVMRYGYPNKIRLDAEGAFKGTDLGERAAEAGVELDVVPAEDHSQIGVVERMGGVLKHHTHVLLQTRPKDPFRGFSLMVAAHNECQFVKGYAPLQWAFGRQFAHDRRLFEGGHGIPFHSAEGTAGTSFQDNLQARVTIKAEGEISKRFWKILGPRHSRPTTQASASGSDRRTELEKNEQFMEQKRKRSDEERMLLADIHDDETSHAFHLADSSQAVCQMDLPLPETSHEWRLFERDATAWAVQALRKTEVRWSSLDAEGKSKFEAAKQAEVDQWLRAEATKAVSGHVPSDRVVPSCRFWCASQATAPKHMTHPIPNELPSPAQAFRFLLTRSMCLLPVGRSRPRQGNTVLPSFDAVRFQAGVGRSSASRRRLCAVRWHRP
eukprot:s3418_g3.t1